MEFEVDPTALQASSREIRRSRVTTDGMPAAVRQAFRSVADNCGDGACASSATALAGSWHVALGALTGDADALATGTGQGATAYGGTENAVIRAVGVAR